VVLAAQLIGACFSVAAIVVVAADYEAGQVIEAIL
jgi:hypothetical protein